MESSGLLENLKALEIELHQPKCRADASRLNEVLHKSFVEFGRGGAIYTKQTIIDALSEEDGTLKVVSRNYSLQLVNENSALVLYQSAHQNSDGSLHRFSNRSSLWVFEKGHWQMYFHQGTPTNAFSKSST